MIILLEVLLHMMKYVALVLLLLPMSCCYAATPTPNSVLKFYITDENLVTNHRGIMTISTAGLVEFTINGHPIPGPSEMVETGIDSGIFLLELTLPSSAGGHQLQDGDVVVMTYHQPVDYSGHPQTITQSVTLRSVQAGPVESTQKSVKIGQYFTLTLYAPNYNLDSQVPDDIPVSQIGVHMGGVSTTLADRSFSLNNNYLRETGRNTNTFQITFKIPREIDGFPVEMGSTLEFRFMDNSQPIPSESSVFVKIGTYNMQNPTIPPSPQPPSMIIATTSSIGTTVNFLNSTVLKGLVDPTCYPSPGSFFYLGTATVICSAKDQNGNSVTKSFTITITRQSNSIPHWIKNLAGFWCKGSINDGDFKTALEFLNSKGALSITEPTQTIQPPYKPSVCMWSQGDMTDDEVSNVFYYIMR